RIIPLARILDSLKFADGLQLLHFSSCLVGQDSERALIAAPFPVSGYKTSVDWAQSALIEFVYLDMILEKGLSPAAAAEQLVSLVRVARRGDISGSASLAPVVRRRRGDCRLALSARGLLLLRQFGGRRELIAR